MVNNNIVFEFTERNYILKKYLHFYADGNLENVM